VIASIMTARLDLIPMTPEFLRTSLDRNVMDASRLIGLKLPDTWPDCADVLSLRLKQLEASPELQPWLLRAIALRNGGEMIGHIGFHTAPGAAYLDHWCPGGVEFGFTVFSSQRRQGYAREAAEALIRWASEVHGVKRFVLTISPKNQPSQALAASLGFTRIGEHEDEVDGVEDVLSLQVAVSPNNRMQRSGPR
jgi:[ribosomal protein S5]-alanine N-acetyltransferase